MKKTIINCIIGVLGIVALPLLIGEADTMLGTIVTKSLGCIFLLGGSRVYEHFNGEESV